MPARRWVRGVVVLVVAAGINALMFGAIQMMVVNRRIRLADANNFDMTDFIRTAEQSRDVRSRRDPKAPQKPDRAAQQELNQLANAAKGGGTLGGIEVDLPQIDVDVDVGGIAIARELTPLVRFPPEYPMRARSRRIEGYVVVQFTVTETGAVAEPEVVQADPPGVFDRAAVRAVLRWKYQPQMVGGKPASVVTYTKINFKLQKEQRQG